MANHIDEDVRLLEVSEDLLSAESLSPLGKPQSKKTALKPRVSSGSSSKQKATMSRTSTTSKPCAQSDRQHDAVMEGLKQLQDQQLASLSSLGTAIISMVSTIKEFMGSNASVGSHKGKRNELSDSDVDKLAIDDAITESVDLTEAYEMLITADKPPEQLTEGEDNVLAELSKIYDSQGAVSDAVSTQMANLVDKMAKTKLSEENAKDNLAK